jgi:hypothetical protein
MAVQHYVVPMAEGDGTSPASPDVKLRHDPAVGSVGDYPPRKASVGWAQPTRLFPKVEIFGVLDRARPVTR